MIDDEEEDVDEDNNEWKLTSLLGKSKLKEVEKGRTPRSSHKTLSAPVCHAESPQGPLMQASRTKGNRFSQLALPEGTL